MILKSSRQKSLWYGLLSYLRLRHWLGAHLSRLYTEQGQGQTEFALIIFVVVLVVIIILTVFGLVLYRYWDDLAGSLPF